MMMSKDKSKIIWYGSGGIRTHAPEKTGALDRSATLPKIILQQFRNRDKHFSVFFFLPQRRVFKRKLYDCETSVLRLWSAGLIVLLAALLAEETGTPHSEGKAPRQDRETEEVFLLFCGA